ncbi:MAG TPA: dienelactone hydrolase family protein [Casimicrobiaceae bacterium]|nr:dienelactone hydrolase family protein [Casimicrobiaceae bacterium]
MTQPTSTDVRIPCDGILLSGTLSRPPRPRGIVAFAHGSGSSRLSPRNVYVAQVLFDAGFGALLFDLLTQDEDRDYATRFDIDLLSDRLRGATRWLRDEPQAQGLPLGYFGASTGAAAALVAAADPDSGVGAVVSRGGRPDLAGAQALGRVGAPTLLIVGGEDHEVIALNRSAYARLRCEKELSIVPGATHLFEEPGTLEEVARQAAQWFTGHLAVPLAYRDPGVRPGSSS